MTKEQKATLDSLTDKVGYTEILEQFAPRARKSGHYDVAGILDGARMCIESVSNACDPKDDWDE